jgi:hypothetical protein
MTTTSSLLTVDALRAVERALNALGVTLLRHSLGSSLYRLEYDVAGDSVALVGWGDGLYFVDDELPPEIASLIRAHAHLACAAPVDSESFSPPGR